MCSGNCKTCIYRDRCREEDEDYSDYSCCSDYSYDM